MGAYAGARYEYAVMVEILGVHSDNNQDPPYISVDGEAIESTTPVEALRELGLKGWQVCTTTATPFGDDAESALVFIILSRPV